uniref:Bestrophin homolog n=1 Tax=Coccolithus braarudii TaxID=221442 RepID=A0A7S0LFS8_9EUKA
MLLARCTSAFVMPTTTRNYVHPRASLAMTISESAQQSQQQSFLDRLSRIPLSPTGSDADARGKRDDWRKNLRNIPKSAVLRRIRGHIFFNVFLATALCTLRHFGVLQISFSPVPHTLAGAFLGLLVTFRTNSAYARFWEARIIWGGIMNTCRALAVNSRVWINPERTSVSGRFIEAVREYPLAVMRQCLSEPQAMNTPVDVCQRMQTSLRNAALPSSLGGPLGLYELQLAEMARRVDTLVDATGALRRIISTPLPLSYGRHSSRFLTLWVSTLPLALGSSVGFTATISAVALISWLVLGIDSIGQLLEQPFSQPKNMGDAFDFGLPVETLANGVVSEVERIGKQGSD